MKNFFLLITFILIGLCCSSQPLFNGKRFELKGIKLGLKNKVYFLKTTVGGYPGTITTVKDKSYKVTHINFITDKPQNFNELSVFIRLFCNFYKIDNYEAYLRETTIIDKYPPIEYYAFQYYDQDRIKVDIYLDNITRQIKIDAEDLSIYKEWNKLFIKHTLKDF